MDRSSLSALLLRPALAATVALASASAGASTLTQNVSWTIDRSGTSAKYRVVAYGDSIYAGYYGSISRASRSAPRRSVDGEYLSQAWNADIEVVRRAKSGAVASDIYNNKIVERALVHADDEHARRDLRDVRQRRPAGAQQLRRPERHLQLRAARHRARTTARRTSRPRCSTSTPTRTRARSSRSSPTSTIRATPPTTRSAAATTRARGRRSTSRTKFLPYLAKMNWRACNFASQYGFAVRRQLRAVHGRRLRLERRRAHRLGGARLRAGRDRGRLRDRRSATRCRVHAARREHALREREHELRLHPVGQHPPDLHRLHGLARASRRLGLGLGRAGTAAARSSAARTRSGTSTATSAWAGRSRC